MDDGVVATWIGTLASLIGAGYAFKQAGDAKDAASEAKRVQASLVDHRKAAELAELQNACRHALKALSRYGPGAVPESLKGASTSADAKEIQDFLVAVKEQRAHFDSKQPNEADVFYSDSTPQLESLARAVTVEQMCEAGGRLFVLLTSFSAVIKRQADLRREMVH